MPVMIPVQSVKVDRNGPVIPTIGEPFDFTDDEITELDVSAPEALTVPDVRAAERLLAAVQAAQNKPAPKARGRGKAKADEDMEDL